MAVAWKDVESMSYVQRPWKVRGAVQTLQVMAVLQPRRYSERGYNQAVNVTYDCGWGQPETWLYRQKQLVGNTSHWDFPKESEEFDYGCVAGRRR